MSDGQERNQAATQHKLREAQKKGQVAKSTEANYAAVLAALAGVCFGMGPAIAQRELAVARGALNAAGRADWSADGVAQWLTQWLSDGMQALAPLLLAIAVLTVLANVAQTGAVFSFDPLKPDFSKLNLAQGLKRLFSMRVLYEALRSVLKLALLAWVAWTAIAHMLPALLKLSYVNARGHAAVALGQVGPLLLKLLLAIMLIAVIDLLYSRWSFAKKMRMSHRDITDEHKQREGDPRIRSRLRQLRNEMLKQAKSARRVPEADVLITNPTHIAIALSYRHGEMPAPKMLAKGSGKLAEKMRELARQHSIPVVQNAPLARALFKRLSADEYVPQELYPKVAKILIWVYAMRQARHGVRTSNQAGYQA